SPGAGAGVGPATVAAGSGAGSGFASRRRCLRCRSRSRSAASASGVPGLSPSLRGRPPRSPPNCGTVARAELAAGTFGAGPGVGPGATDGETEFPAFVASISILRPVEKTFHDTLALGLWRWRWLGLLQQPAP